MNILITGGSRGIGRETALALAADKDNQVIVTGRDENALRSLENEAPWENISRYIFDFSAPTSSFSAFSEHVSSL
jgi:NAD(P)-dependent dehydrogenase (short-subunit alcohol dehydrogenase family)